MVADKPRIRTVLVVEDERIIAMHMKAVLSRLGYDVQGTASTGEEAVRLAEDLQPDLVLMDIRLADGSMAGISAAARIQEQRDVPVIYVSAFAEDPTVAELARSSGHRAKMLVKPVDVGRLQAAIEDFCNRQ